MGANREWSKTSVARVQLRDGLRTGRGNRLGYGDSMKKNVLASQVSVTPSRRLFFCIAALLLMLPAACGAPVPVLPRSTVTETEPTCRNAQERAEIRAARPAAEARSIAIAEASRGSGSPALWTLADEDTTVHILGTVHLLKPDLDWRSPAISAAIGASGRVVFEADTSSPEAGRALMNFFSEKGLYSDGRRLSNVLTAEERAELESSLALIGLPLDAIEPMRPWYAALNMSVMQITQEGFQPEAGVEKAIEIEAKRTGAELAYLETIDQQLGEFAELEDCEQVEFLMMTAEGVKQGTSLLDLLVAEWADGDINGLAVLMSNPESFGSDAVYDAMLKNRNRRWVSQIVAELDAPGEVLVAVGAGHLAGDDSVIAMLRAEGYAVSGP